MFLSVWAGLFLKGKKNILQIDGSLNEHSKGCIRQRHCCISYENCLYLAKSELQTSVNSFILNLIFFNMSAGKREIAAESV